MILATPHKRPRMLTNTYEYLAIILRSLRLVANCIRKPIRHIFATIWRICREYIYVLPWRVCQLLLHCDRNSFDVILMNTWYKGWYRAKCIALWFARQATPNNNTYVYITKQNDHTYMASKVRGNPPYSTQYNSISMPTQINMHL